MVETVNTFNEQPVITKKKKNLIPLVVIIGVVLLILGIFAFGRFPKTKPEKISPTPQEEPTPTQKPKIDKKEVKIKILNGTGTPGQAGEVAKILEEEGYDLEKITTANAEEFGQKITTITARSGFEELVDEIKQALEEKFGKVEIESTELDEESEYDVVITTGGKKYEEPTTSPSPTTPTEEPTPTDTPTPTPTPTP